MISCHDFRSAFTAETSDPRLLEHVRACDACLDYAAGIDAGIVFRAIGGGELVPPGGVDAFVDDVMRQVRVRSAAKVVNVQRHWSWQKWSAAAAIVVGITAGTLSYQHSRQGAGSPAPVPPRAIPVAANLTTKPVVETYESENATIVEVPPAHAGGAQVVMIFDESLPSDL
ncbi:MAG: hypothetical protein ACXW19_12870 [Thermoanaerobaculia bacterium]